MGIGSYVFGGGGGAFFCRETKDLMGISSESADANGRGGTRQVSLVEMTLDLIWSAVGFFVPKQQEEKSSPDLMSTKFLFRVDFCATKLTVHLFFGHCIIPQISKRRS